MRSLCFWLSMNLCLVNCEQFVFPYLCHVFEFFDFMKSTSSLISSNRRGTHTQVGLDFLGQGVVVQCFSKGGFGCSGFSCRGIFSLT